MHWRTGRVNPAAVARYDRIYPIVIDITVEYFPPIAAERESDAIVVPGVFRKRRDHDNVVPRSLQPTVKCDHSVLVVNMKWIDIIASQRGVIPAKPDQVLRKAQMIHTSDVRSCIQSSPRNQ